MTKTNISNIQKITEKFLEMLGVVATVLVEEGEENSARITLETEDSGMLIGYHGETLEALQLILSLVVAKELGEFTRLSLEIGDYRKNREEWLKQIVEQTRDRVLQEGRAFPIYNLKSWERREVHMMLVNDPDVTSESEGEGRDRVLVIKPKNTTPNETQE